MLCLDCDLYNRTGEIVVTESHYPEETNGIVYKIVSKKSIDKEISKLLDMHNEVK